MVTRRRGASKLGCLIALLLAVTVGYFGFNVGEVYWRSYRFQDAIQQQFRFARQKSDDAIRRSLRAYADSIGIPVEVDITVRRSANRITIQAEYQESVELPGVVHIFRFSPAASGGL